MRYYVPSNSNSIELVSASVGILEQYPAFLSVIANNLLSSSSLKMVVKFIFFWNIKFSQQIIFNNNFAFIGLIVHFVQAKSFVFVCVWVNISCYVLSPWITLCFLYNFFLNVQKNWMVPILLSVVFFAAWKNFTMFLARFVITFVGNSCLGLMGFIARILVFI